MAHRSTGAATLAQRAADPSSKDLDRFRKSLRRGNPGPHGYVVLLGLEALDAPEILRALKKGLAYHVFERLRQNTSLPLERLLEIIDMPRRTLTRRKRDGRFLPAESDRLLRASRVFGAALQLFEGDRDAAVEWLGTPQPALGGTTPLDLAHTDVGSREVERLIGRLEHGVFS